MILIIFFCDNFEIHENLGIHVIVLFLKTMKIVTVKIKDLHIMLPKFHFPS
jgi:hypothetical protein